MTVVMVVGSGRNYTHIKPLDCHCQHCATSESHALTPDEKTLIPIHRSSSNGFGQEYSVHSISATVPSINLFMSLPILPSMESMEPVPPLIINSLAISGPPITRAFIMAIGTIADGVGGISLSSKDRGDTNHTGEG